MAVKTKHSFISSIDFILVRNFLPPAFWCVKSIQLALALQLKLTRSHWGSHHSDTNHLDKHIFFHPIRRRKKWMFHWHIIEWRISHSCPLSTTAIKLKWVLSFYDIAEVIKFKFNFMDDFCNKVGIWVATRNFQRPKSSIHPFVFHFRITNDLKVYELQLNVHLKRINSSIQFINSFWSRQKAFDWLLARVLLSRLISLSSFSANYTNPSKRTNDRRPSLTETNEQ